VQDDDQTQTATSDLSVDDASDVPLELPMEAIKAQEAQRALEARTAQAIKAQQEHEALEAIKARDEVIKGREASLSSDKLFMIPRNDANVALFKNLHSLLKDLVMDANVVRDLEPFATQPLEPMPSFRIKRAEDDGSKPWSDWLGRGREDSAREPDAKIAGDETRRSSFSNVSSLSEEQQRTAEDAMEVIGAALDGWVPPSEGRNPPLLERVNSVELLKARGDLLKARGEDLFSDGDDTRSTDAGGSSSASDFDPDFGLSPKSPRSPATPVLHQPSPKKPGPGSSAPRVLLDLVYHASSLKLGAPADNETPHDDDHMDNIMGRNDVGKNDVALRTAAFGGI
jgi:hypothetical protein